MDEIKTKVLYFHSFFAPPNDSVARVIFPPIIESKPEIDVNKRTLNGHSGCESGFIPKTITQIYRGVEKDILDCVNSTPQDIKIYILGSSGSGYITRTAIHNLLTHNQINDTQISGILLFHPVTDVELSMKNCFEKNKKVREMTHKFCKKSLIDMLDLENSQDIRGFEGNEHYLGTAQNPFNLGSIPLTIVYSENDSVVGNRETHRAGVSNESYLTFKELGYEHGMYTESEKVQLKEITQAVLM